LKIGCSLNADGSSKKLKDGQQTSAKTIRRKFQLELAIAMLEAAVVEFRSLI